MRNASIAAGMIISEKAIHSALSLKTKCIVVVLVLRCYQIQYRQTHKNVTCVSSVGLQDLANRANRTEVPGK